MVFKMNLRSTPANDWRQSPVERAQTLSVHRGRLGVVVPGCWSGAPGLRAWWWNMTDGGQLLRHTWGASEEQTCPGWNYLPAIEQLPSHSLMRICVCVCVCVSVCVCVYVCVHMGVHMYACICMVKYSSITYFSIKILLGICRMSALSIKCLNKPYCPHSTSWTDLNSLSCLPCHDALLVHPFGSQSQGARGPTLPVKTQHAISIQLQYLTYGHQWPSNQVNTATLYKQLEVAFETFTPA